MTTTYSTSTECAYVAGMKTCDTTTRPTSTMVDLFRDIAYGKIVRIIGSGIVDVSNFLKGKETRLVAIMIHNVIDGTVYNADFNQEEINELLSFSSPTGTFGIYVYEPNKDGSLYGDG